MANYYDRDTKVAYVEQIKSGKLTVTDAVKELDCSRSAIYSCMKKLSEEGEYGLLGSGHMKPDKAIKNNLKKKTSS